MLARRKFFNSILPVQAHGSEKKTLQPHYALKRWIVPECAIDCYGLNDIAPDIPAYLVTAAYFFMDEKVLMSKIYEFYHLLYIARN